MPIKRLKLIFLVQGINACSKKWFYVCFIYTWEGHTWHKYLWYNATTGSVVDSLLKIGCRVSGVKTVLNQVTFYTSLRCHLTITFRTNHPDWPDTSSNDLSYFNYLFLSTLRSFIINRSSTYNVLKLVFHLFFATTPLPLSLPFKYFSVTRATGFLEFCTTHNVYTGYNDMQKEVFWWEPGWKQVNLK